jgi:glucosamine--fructose-6-phosphate aminotransferase (isomerizing)
MCGIVAVLPEPSSAAAADPSEVAGLIEALGSDLAGAAARLTGVEAGRLEAVAAGLRAQDARLRGAAGLRTMLAPGAIELLEEACQRVEAAAVAMESALDAVAARIEPAEQEAYYSATVAVKDACWSLAKDRLGLARRVQALRGERPCDPGTNLDGWWAIAVALSSIDRLEVRGRDSAGIHVLVSGVATAEMEREAAARTGNPLFPNGAIRFSAGTAGFVYKAAAEIGELGDNVRAISAAVAADRLLARTIEDGAARVAVVGHTRWASVGIISEPNTHPLDSGETGRPVEPYIVAALNGDVDNHFELRKQADLRYPSEVTTDAKIIPTLVARRLDAGASVDDAFAETVATFEGSVAIAASAAVDPDRIHLALSGSGQSLYVGLAPGAFVVASEPYGLVEETPCYLRMDGEATQGEIVTLSRRGAGSLGGLTRRRYSGGVVEVTPGHVETAEITTRDVDRQGFDHYLLKEIGEAPGSLRKTLRGRVTTVEGGRLDALLGEDSIPADLAAALADGRVRRVMIIGQGTAAVAGQAVAAAMRHCLGDLVVHAMPATELSGFSLEDDMSHTLVVAISQSGTTTDTNRTVDLARTRGAHVIAVVNRRNSDLAAKSHGVIHTSDGRDVEMSVASTKAFYAQVAAGWLLALGLAARMPVGGRLDPDARTRILEALLDLPAAMETVLAAREEIGRIAAAVAPPRRYWAVVGSGPDRVAASEVRIKLSELCYRSISADTTEDKKHIDLSCEPMILVCAAGLRGPNADDAAKEVAIYRAHKAAPVVVAAEGEDERFRSVTRDVIVVPRTEPVLAFILSAMVGHLFGYEAALSIDAQARTLRGVRQVLDTVAGDDPDRTLAGLQPALRHAAAPFLDGLRAGTFNGNLEASTAVRLVSLLRYATGALPLEGYESETGKIGTPEALLADLLDGLGEAIDELTRPIDAIKHQAKTVTVGISRSEDALFGIPLVKATLAAGAAPDTLGYRALRTLGALDDGVEEVLGFTRYRIEGSPADPTALVIDRGGVAASLRSRYDQEARLTGSKHRAADEREVTIIRGARDGRTVILVPEVKGQQVTGLTLLHVRFADRLPAERAAAVLTGYRTRYSAVSDAVTETEPTFDVARLGTEPLIDLLTVPVLKLAERWRDDRP